MYHNIFALDETLFKDSKAIDKTSHEYFLNNYSYYLPKLEKDFYLRVFIKKAIFDIDIMELESFLSFQLEYSENKENYIKALKLKVIPSIDTILTNASFSFEGTGGYYNETKLEDGFVETEGVIKNKNYEFYMFYHWTSFGQLKEDIKERKVLIIDFLKKIETIDNNANPNTLNWCGKPSHLAFLIRSLVDEGYITPPLGKNKEINLTELSRQTQIAFNIENKTSVNTLRVYLNTESEKNIELTKNFKNQGFSLPNSGLLG